MSATERADHAAIREVLARYMRAVRLHDVDLMDDVFTADAVIDYTAIGGSKASWSDTKAWLQGMLDAEGDWIAAVRQTVGEKCLITASYDLHGNVSQRIIDALDMYSTYRTAPHIDVEDTMRRSVKMLVESLTTPISENAHDKLSDRELQTLVMIASGKRLSDIAEELTLSPKTVSVYRARVLEKLGLQNNAELTVYAIRNGLVGE